MQVSFVNECVEKTHGMMTESVDPNFLLIFFADKCVRISRSLSLCLAIYLSVCLSLSHSVTLSHSLCLSVCLSVSLTGSLPLFFSLFLSLSLSLFLPLPPSRPPPLYLSLSLQPQCLPFPRHPLFMDMRANAWFPNVQFRVKLCLYAGSLQRRGSKRGGVQYAAKGLQRHTLRGGCPIRLVYLESRFERGRARCHHALELPALAIPTKTKITTGKTGKSTKLSGSWSSLE
eukprot:COSAG05_NODE_3185_length_2260_cov_2.344285_5_plen_230_part_00